MDYFTIIYHLSFLLGVLVIKEYLDIKKRRLVWKRKKRMYYLYKMCIKETYLICLKSMEIELKYNHITNTFY